VASIAKFLGKCSSWANAAGFEEEIQTHAEIAFGFLVFGF
jgi:hypothetical protein